VNGNGIRGSRARPDGSGHGRRWWTGGLLALLILGAPGCTTVSPAPRPDLSGLDAADRDRITRNLQIFDTAWNVVDRRYFDPEFNGVDWDEAARTHGPQATAAASGADLYDEINEMFEELEDSHVRASGPDAVRERRTERRNRTGFSYQRVEETWVVTEVLPDSPAAEAGVQRGWLVLSRNGIPVGDGLDVRPEAGEVATWEFLDSADSRVALELEARLLSIAPRREVRILPGGIIYLRFDAFFFGEWFWVRSRLRENPDAPGVVLDLRRNGGGHVFALALMLGEFLPTWSQGGELTSRSGVDFSLRALHLGLRRRDPPLAVLIGPGSASAAEIFAAVVREHGRGTLVGEATAGAVLGSIFLPLPDGGEVQVSITDYRTPDGLRLEGTGVAPDVAIPATLADFRTDRDPALDAAMLRIDPAGENSVPERGPVLTTPPAGED
jgi:carboxyl-terminal processing protease